MKEMIGYKVDEMNKLINKAHYSIQPVKFVREGEEYFKKSDSYTITDPVHSINKITYYYGAFGSLSMNVYYNQDDPDYNYRTNHRRIRKPEFVAYGNNTHFLEEKDGVKVEKVVPRIDNNEVCSPVFNIEDDLIIDHDNFLISWMKNILNITNEDILNAIVYKEVDRIRIFDGIGSSDPNTHNFVPLTFTESEIDLILNLIDDDHLRSRMHTLLNIAKLSHFATPEELYKNYEYYKHLMKNKD